MSLTNLKIVPSGEFEVWVEYSIPKGLGVVVGTGVYSLSLTGSIDLKEMLGTHFVPQIP